MTLGRVRVMGTGVVVMMYVEEVYAYIIYSSYNTVILIPQARVMEPSGLYVYIRQSTSACGISACTCRLMACQYEVETRIYYIDYLGKSIMGLHMQADTPVIPTFVNKWANPIESVESSYKRLNSCFVAIALFHKVYYTSKDLTFFLKQISRVFRKMDVVLN